MGAAVERYVGLAHLPAVASWEEIVVKVVLSCEPSLLTTVRMAIETPAAISPYSIAVAPDLSFTKRFNVLAIVRSFCISLGNAEAQG